MFVKTENGWDLRFLRTVPRTKYVIVEESDLKNHVGETIFFSSAYQKYVRVIPAGNNPDNHWDSEALRKKVHEFIAWLERENAEAKDARRGKPGLFTRLKKVEALRDGAMTPGERSAAEAAIERIVAGDPPRNRPYVPQKSEEFITLPHSTDVRILERNQFA